MKDAIKKEESLTANPAKNHAVSSGGTECISPFVDYSTGEPALKSPAQALFDRIGTGKENALKINHRNNNDRVAREVRHMIHYANTHGDLIITDMDSEGYYRPRPDRPEEMEAAEKYVAMITARAATTTHTAECLAETLETVKKATGIVCYTRKASPRRERWWSAWLK